MRTSIITKVEDNSFYTTYFLDLLDISISNAIYIQAPYENLLQLLLVWKHSSWNSDFLCLSVLQNQFRLVLSIEWVMACKCLSPVNASILRWLMHRAVDMGDFYIII